jgi:acylphosphatase
VNAIRHLVIRGRVQGVGYRAFVEDTATSRGLSGWVRNRRDGTVEAMFSGPEDAVSGMIEDCCKGPFGARVDGIDMREARADELQIGRTFTVLPTA